VIYNFRSWNRNRE